MSKKVLHYNKPQIKTMLVKAWETYGVMSRGVGKTTGVLAPWYQDIAQELPQGSSGIVAATFQQALTRTLPPVIEGWERLGYKRDVHFSIGKPFPKSWNVPQPIVKPLDSSKSIYWFNGHTHQIFSQDRVGSANGTSLQALGGDEAKLLNKARLDEEIMPALRGKRDRFGKSHYYRAKMFLTDMPTSEKGKWILDKVNEMDPQRIAVIMELQVKLNILLIAYNQAPKSKRIKELRPRINKLSKMLWELRMGKDGRSPAIYYLEANAYDNIDVLGEDYIKDMKRNLSDLTFRASVLNEQLNKIEGGFYGYLDEDKHAYDAFNYSYLDDFEYDFGNDALTTQDSRHDGDLDKSTPLDVAFDYGSNINCMVVGQEYNDEYRALAGFHVLHPLLIKDLVNKFCDYYKHFPVKQVNYYYDHTAIGGIGTTDYTYHSQVLETFHNRGWLVNEVWIGQAPPHDRKYELWGEILKESNPRLPKFRFNKNNCNSMSVSMMNAGIKIGRKGFEKDKSTERPSNGVFKVPPEESTHYSDAVDTLVIGRYLTQATSSSEYIPSSM